MLYLLWGEEGLRGECYQGSLAKKQAPSVSKKALRFTGIPMKAVQDGSEAQRQHRNFL